MDEDGGDELDVLTELIDDEDEEELEMEDDGEIDEEEELEVEGVLVVEAGLRAM